MGFVDIGIPANNKGKHSIGCLFWLLARMVLQMRGTILAAQKWDVMVNSRNTIRTCVSPTPDKDLDLFLLCRWICFSTGSPKKQSKRVMKKLKYRPIMEWLVVTSGPLLKYLMLHGLVKSNSQFLLHLQLAVSFFFIIVSRNLNTKCSNVFAVSFLQLPLLLDGRLLLFQLLVGSKSSLISLARTRLDVDLIFLFSRFGED